MFVYLITNLTNGKQYVGKTEKSVNVRFKEHLYRSQCDGTVDRQYISKAIAKYGKENFYVETIYEASAIDELNEKEIEFINKFNTLAPKGYNLSQGGEGVSHTEMTKSKISAKNTGKKRNEKSKLKMRLAKLGKKQSQEHIENAANGKKLGQVIGINTRDNSIISFESASDAIKEGFNTGHISSCISGKRKSHKGYRWVRCQAS